MKLKKATFILLVMMLVIITTACINPFLPVYEKTDEDGMSVYIEGVRYKLLPVQKWDVNPTTDGKIIGYAGDRNTQLIEAEGDSNRNFICVKGTIADYYDSFIYRADIDISEPSADNVDKLLWVEYVVGGDEEYNNILKDKNTISELFNLLETGDKNVEFEMIKKNSEIIEMLIYCESSDLPGACYELSVGLRNGKIICGSRREGRYVEMPVELLEKIADKSFEGVLY